MNLGQSDDDAPTIVDFNGIMETYACYWKCQYTLMVYHSKDGVIISGSASRSNSLRLKLI